MVLACGEALIQISGPELDGFLRREFNENERQAVRAFSLIHLAGESQDESQRAWLQEIAGSDADPEIRRLALDLLGEGDGE